MSEVHILGAGGLARDFYACFKSEITIAGFWDDHVHAGTIIDGVPVLGNIDDFCLVKKPVLYVIMTGNPFVRKAIFEKSHKSFHRSPVLIHSLSRIFNPKKVEIGNGTVIFPGVYVTTNVRIGINTIIHIGCSIHHDVIIGNNNVLMPGVRMTGNTTTGNEVFLGPNAVMTNGQKTGDGERIEY